MLSTSLDDLSWKATLRPGIQLTTSATGTFSRTIDSVGFVAGPHEAWAADGNTGKESLHATFTVTTVAPTCTLTASSSTIKVGESSTLTWITANNPITAIIDNGIGSVNPAGGSTSVSPTTTTTYTLTVTNTAGSNICSAQVTVNPAGPAMWSQFQGDSRHTGRSPFRSICFSFEFFEAAFEVCYLNSLQ